MNRILLSLAGVMVLALSYVWLTSITDPDIYAYNQFPLRAETEPVEAGNIVAISSDGGMSRICQPELPADMVEEKDTSGIYYNALSDKLPEVIGVVQSVAGWVTGDAATTDQAANRSERPFVGVMSFYGQGSEQLALNDTCQCKMAWRIALGETVCTVRKALVKTEISPGFHVPRRQTVAVTLAPEAQLMHRSIFELCGFAPPSDAVLIGGGSCGATSLPFDARLRQLFRVIDRRDMPQTQARL